MAVQQVTTVPTEADLEARIGAAVRAAFAWLPADGLSHQITFAFKFGHNTATINGAEMSTAQPRLDILVSYKDMPIAVMELKREGLPLTADDDFIAASARMRIAFDALDSIASRRERVLVFLDDLDLQARMVELSSVDIAWLPRR